MAETRGQDGLVGAGGLSQRLQHAATYPRESDGSVDIGAVVEDMTSTGVGMIRI
jgi:hypothetical protein